MPNDLLYQQCVVIWINNMGKRTFKTYTNQGCTVVDLPLSSIQKIPTKAQIANHSAFSIWHLTLFYILKRIHSMSIMDPASKFTYSRQAVIWAPFRLLTAFSSSIFWWQFFTFRLLIKYPFCNHDNEHLQDVLMEKEPV